MSVKKKSPTKAQKKNTATLYTSSQRKLRRIAGSEVELELNISGSSNGTRRTQPVRINPETEEEREKRLANREARTLKAFRAAYESTHRLNRRKAS